MRSSEISLRQIILDWLDDNYHFGDAAKRIASDEQSFLKNGILDSLGFVQLCLFIEKRFSMRLDRKALSPANFDGLGKIMTYLLAHPDYKGPRA